MKKLLPLVLMFLFFVKSEAQTFTMYAVYDPLTQSISLKNPPQTIFELRETLIVVCKGFPAGSAPTLAYTSDNNNVSQTVAYTAASSSFSIGNDNARTLLNMDMTVDWVKAQFTIYGSVANPVKTGTCLIYNILNNIQTNRQAKLDTLNNKWGISTFDNAATTAIQKTFKKRDYKSIPLDKLNISKLDAASCVRIFGKEEGSAIFKAKSDANAAIYRARQDAINQAIQDSITQARADSINLVRIDSINRVLRDSNIFWDSNDMLLDEQITSAPVSGASDASVPMNGPDMMTNVLEGITSFAIARSKQELNIAFFSRLKKYLAIHPEAKILFPSTLALLNKIASFQFNEFLPKLRQSFYSDLNSLPDDIIGLISLPKYQQMLANFPEITVAIKSISAVRKIKSPQFHIAEIIDTLAQVSNVAPPVGRSDAHFLENYHTTIELINIISKAMIDVKTGQYYDRKVLETFIEDPIKLGTLINAILIEIQIHDLTIYRKDGAPISVSKLFADITSQDVVIKTFLQNVIIAVDDLRQAQNTLNALAANSATKSADEKKATLDYLDAAAHCVDVMANVFSLLDGADVTTYSSMIHSLFQISENAVNQDYSSLVFNTIGFVENTLEMCFTDTANAQIRKSLNVVRQITTYANFAANVVQAKSSTDVMNAISATALPPGSSSIKKASLFNVSLQLYLGGSYNFWNKRYPTNPSKSWSSALGVTLPVGVSFNFGLHKGGSLGVMGMIMDLGALAQYQITHSDSVSGESFRFQNVFSPGVMFSYGLFCNVPLAINFGWQYGPGLTKVMAGTETLINPSWRLLLSVVVDIPAFTLVNVGSHVKAQTLKPKSLKRKDFVSYR